jgi:hypothetical protein
MITGSHPVDDAVREPHRRLADGQPSQLVHPHRGLRNRQHELPQGLGRAVGRQPSPTGSTRTRALSPSP